MEVKSICIVGGGSAGWLTAYALNRHAPDLNITLIEAPGIPTIGVGESTIPYTSNFLKNFLGFEESEWMPFCNATYKASIRFNNFNNSGESLYHPFWTSREDSYNGYAWAAYQQLNPEASIHDYYRKYFISFQMSENVQFDKLEGEGFEYSHHLDAEQLGLYCKNKLLSSPRVSLLEGLVTEVNRGEDGYIESLSTDVCGSIPADLYIDCTGFRSVLMKGMRGASFTKSAEPIINDKAVVCRVPYSKYSKRKELEPYTDCTALSAGWAWNIPLWDRIGTGYVYSSKFLTEEEASQEYRAYLAKRFSVDRVESLKFAHIHIRTGEYKETWIGNCISVGLASGFIEPLESTGLALLAYQITNIVREVTQGHYSNLSRACYNYRIRDSFEEVHDFMSLHYLNLDREDTPYWKYLTKNAKVTDRLARISRTLRVGLPHKWFPSKSWECILLGFKIPGEYTDNLTYREKLLKNYPPEEVEKVENELLKYFEELENYAETLKKSLTNHCEYLQDTIYHEN